MYAQRYGTYLKHLSRVQYMHTSMHICMKCTHVSVGILLVYAQTFYRCKKDQIMLRYWVWVYIRAMYMCVCACVCSIIAIKMQNTNTIQIFPRAIVLRAEAFFSIRKVIYCQALQCNANGFELSYAITSILWCIFQTAIFNIIDLISAMLFLHIFWCAPKALLWHRKIIVQSYSSY